MTDFERSHAELHAAGLLDGKEIRMLNFGRADSQVLGILRRVLREARAAQRRVHDVRPTLPTGHYAPCQ